jgi:hypothetical protein
MGHGNEESGFDQGSVDFPWPFLTVEALLGREIFGGSTMALRARGEDENEIEWGGDRQAEVGEMLVLRVRCRNWHAFCRTFRKLRDESFTLVHNFFPSCRSFSDVGSNVQCILIRCLLHWLLKHVLNKPVKRTRLILQPSEQCQEEWPFLERSP